MNYVHRNWKNLNTDLDINKFKTIIDDNKINKKKKNLMKILPETYLKIRYDIINKLKKKCQNILIKNWMDVLILYITIKQ